MFGCGSCAARIDADVGGLGEAGAQYAVRDLLHAGIGLVGCSQRLGVALNTVERYVRTAEPDRLRRPPRYRAWAAALSAWAVFMAVTRAWVDACFDGAEVAADLGFGIGDALP